MGKLFSFGNKKLPSTTAIFNMCSATVCPAAKLGLCQLADVKKCYALKAERMYPSVLPYRNRQLQFWLRTTPAEFVIKLMHDVGRKPLLKLRFNEAGDFISQDCVDKATEIASILKLNYDVTTYVYTARRDLDFSERGYLIVNGSGFMVDNSFSTIPKNGVDELLKKTPSAIICGQDCNVCSLCAERGSNKIYVEMH